jgi:hypothetical protein
MRRPLRIHRAYHSAYQLESTLPSTAGVFGPGQEFGDRHAVWRLAERI